MIYLKNAVCNLGGDDNDNEEKELEMKMMIVMDMFCIAATHLDLVS